MDNKYLVKIPLEQHKNFMQALGEQGFEWKSGDKAGSGTNIYERLIDKEPENEISHKTTYYYLDFENKEITYAMNVEVNKGLQKYEKVEEIIAKSKSCEWILEKLESNKTSLLEKSSIDKSIEEDIER